MANRSDHSLRFGTFNQLLDAVEYAHSQGVIHRDIKPDNIMITPDGDKMLDFGISKDIAQSNTKSGVGMGTVAYMAPEQYIDAKRTDQRSDIYALAITFFEMLTGRLPWNHNTSDFEILTLKKEGRLIPLSDLASRFNDRLSKELLRAASADREQRHGTVSEFRHSLLKAMEGFDTLGIIGQFNAKPQDSQHLAQDDSEYRSPAVGFAVKKFWPVALILTIGLVYGAVKTTSTESPPTETVESTSIKSITREEVEREVVSNHDVKPETSEPIVTKPVQQWSFSCEQATLKKWIQKPCPVMKFMQDAVGSLNRRV